MLLKKINILYGIHTIPTFKKVNELMKKKKNLYTGTYS